MQTIGGVECYVAVPEGEYPKDKVVLVLTDVFGIPLINNRVCVALARLLSTTPTYPKTQLLADDFARHGFKTVMPDLFHGDARDISTMNPTFDRAKWVAKHGPETWYGVLDAVVAALKAEGVTRIGTSGYCFGAPPAFYLALKNEVHVTVLAHPSHLDVPGDLEVRTSS